MEEFIGTVKLFAFRFVPRDWALCNGQMMMIRQNEALFNLISTIYGGNGTTTFALPDMRSRMVIGAGQGTNLSQYNVGQTGGAERATLNVANMPAHNHAIAIGASSATKLNPTPSNNFLGGAQIYTNAVPEFTLDPRSAGSSNTGSGTPFGTLPPYLAMNYCICLQGRFPSEQ